jgi:hypothetical protein
MGIAVAGGTIGAPAEGEKTPRRPAVKKRGTEKDWV